MPDFDVVALAFASGSLHSNTILVQARFSDIVIDVCLDWSESATIQDESYTPF